MDIVLKYEGVWQVLFSAELFRKSTVIFPEISGKIRRKFPEISELTTLVLGPKCPYSTPTYGAREGTWREKNYKIQQQ